MYKKKHNVLVTVKALGPLVKHPSPYKACLCVIQNDQLFTRIAKGIREARIVVACVSDEYSKSSNCCKEMNFAVTLKKPVVCAPMGTGNVWKQTEVI